MAPPSPPPPFMAVVLTLLAMGVMSGVQAKPTGQNAPVLDITSSIEIGQPIFGNIIGPLTAGQKLKLTCSADASGSVSLSWWEGDTEQTSSAQEAEGIISSSFTIQTLRIEDNGRRFTCRDQQTQTIKAIEILINTDTSNVLEIIKDGEHIEDGAVVKGTEGEDITLNCIMQGYHPHAVSWWEGGAELESVATKSTYATSSVLSVKALTVDDSRRTFTCRSLNGQLAKTVTLHVIVTEVFISFVQEDFPRALALSIVMLILLFASLLAMVVLIIKTFANKKQAKGRRDALLKGSKIITGVTADNRLMNASKGNKYDKLIESAQNCDVEKEDGSNTL